MAAAAAVLLVISGCASGAPGASGTSGQEKTPPAQVPAESRLVIYTSHKEEVWWPVVKEFEERTGIWVEVEEGGTNEILNRISEERDEPRADVMFGGGIESLQSFPELFQPYSAAGADRIAEQFRAETDLFTPFSALPLVLIYNTKLVEEGDLRGWSDLFREEFQGRIAFADPARSGSCYTALVTMDHALGGGKELLEAFARQVGGKQLESSGAVLSAVESGEALAGVTLEETALKRIGPGHNLAMVYPADGTSAVPDASAMVKGAPHAENAERFLDFTLTEDVQHMLAVRFYRRPVLEDVPAPENLPPLSELGLLPYDVEEASASRESVLMSWEFYQDGGTVQ